MRIQIINGPNLNLLGTREQAVYGKMPFDKYLLLLQEIYADCTIEYFQSNVEGEIINKLHETGFLADGILLNAGGYSHTSVAIADAVAAIKTPVVEIHITNIFAREAYRHSSLIAPKCHGCITGFGLDSYRLGIESLLVIAASGKTGKTGKKKAKN
jgi:3-dehydroquinate dehydratase II